MTAVITETHAVTTTEGTIVMNLDKPWNDVADQLRPAQPDAELPDDEFDLVVEPVTKPIAVLEANPADVADQRRDVPLPDDQQWP